jgi:hypothetical protein
MKTSEGRAHLTKMRDHFYIYISQGGDSLSAPSVGGSRPWKRQERPRPRYSTSIREHGGGRRCVCSRGCRTSHPVSDGMSEEAPGRLRIPARSCRSHAFRSKSQRCPLSPPGKANKCRHSERYNDRGGSLQVPMSDSFAKRLCPQNLSKTRNSRAFFSTRKALEFSAEFRTGAGKDQRPERAASRSMMPSPSIPA